MHKTSQNQGKIAQKYKFTVFWCFAICWFRIKLQFFVSIYVMHFFFTAIWSDCISQLFHSINAHNDFFSLHACLHELTFRRCEIHAYLAADNFREGERFWLKKEFRCMTTCILAFFSLSLRKCFIFLFIVCVAGIVTKCPKVKLLLRDRQCIDI